MSDEQGKPAETAEVKEAAACLRAFEVGIGNICNEIGLTYGEFAKRANTAFKFAEKEEDATGKLAPWLVDQIVAQATKESQPKTC